MSEGIHPNQSSLTPQEIHASLPEEKEIIQIGDVVHGDKFSGDKVGGDKITGEVVVTGYVAGDVIVNLPEKLDIPPPPAPRRPPNVPLLLGREAALDSYSQALASDGLAIISGMAGIGKTSLAASLARRNAKPAHIFWHKFQEAGNVESLIWDLAGFLATHGQDTLWNLIQTAALRHGRPPPTNVQFDYLIQHLQGQPFLLCIDDFHHVIDDPAVGMMVERLMPMLRRGQLKLILTSRELPDFVRRSNHTGLPGLSPEAVKHLLNLNDIHLETAEATQLQTYTGGNPQLLTLAIDLLLGSYDLPTLLQKLVQAADVEDFLMEEIEESLSRQERAVMGAIAILQGYPGSREAIEAILDGQNIRRTVRDLSNRFLLIVTKSDEGDLYNQHAIVQDYFYDSLSKRQKPQMHRLAAEHYRDDARDMFLAARHFLAANDQPEAAEIVVANVYALINRGLAKPVNQLFSRFEADQLDALTWIALTTVTGQIKAFLGENELAQEKFEAAFAQLAGLPTTPETEELTAKVCLGLGELLEFQQPAAGLEWVARGLTLKELTINTQAALNILAGTLHMHLGSYEAAQEAIQAGLNNLSPNPSQERCQALTTLSAVSFYLGDLAQSKAYAAEALNISRQLHDPYREAAILSNQAVAKYTSGEWQAGIEDFQQALKLAKDLGSIRDTAEFQLNLGAAYTNTGAYEAAEQNLTEALQVVTQMGEELLCCLANLRLAELEIRKKNWELATRHLEAAEALAISLGTENQLPAINSFKVEIALAQNDCFRAHKYADKGFTAAKNLDDPFETGIALRMLGLMEAKCGDNEKALAYLQQSFIKLRDLDPFESARSQLEIAALSIKMAAQGGKGKELAAAVRKTFASLGAKYELKRAEELLDTMC